MNTVTFPCTCGATLQIERKMAGMQVRCGNCGTVLIVPDPSNPEALRQTAVTPHGETTVIRWLEPSILKRHENRVPNRWISLGIILGMGIFGVIMRSIVTQGPSPHSYSVVFWGCAGVGILFDIARRIYLYVPSFVIVSKKGINRNTLIGVGAHFDFWPWYAISSGKVEVVTVGYRSVRLLKLYSHDNQGIAGIGMGRSVSVQLIAREFAVMGKTLIQ